MSGFSPGTSGNLAVSENRNCPRRSQRGQAIVLVLLLTVVAVLAGLSLVNTGILTSEKMQLQNAADATAFSVSTIEARDLNFAAYTNRAMIANEVALGQMAGVMSHVSMLTSIPAWLDIAFTIRGIYAIPIVGQIFKGVVQGIASGSSGAKRTANRVLSVPVKNIDLVNRFYSFGQRIMHLATLNFTVASLWDIPSKNVDDSQFSVFGYIALLRHLTTYYPDLRVSYPESFVTYYRQDKLKQKLSVPVTPFQEKPVSAHQQEGMQRLAALINASRDPYSKNRLCTGNPAWGKDGLDVCDEDNGGFALKFLDLHPHFYLPLGLVRTRFGIDFTLALRRHGGSDLRYKEVGKDKRYTWTAADQMGMTLNLGFFVKIEVNTLIDGWKTVTNIRESLPTISEAFGVGGAQVGRLTDGALPFPDTFMMPDTIGGQVEGDFYGNNPGILPLVWLVPTPLSPNALPPSWATPENNLLPTYEGLPRYNDTKRMADPIQAKLSPKTAWGLEAPYFLVALEKPLEKIPQSETTGRFKLDPDAAADKIAVISKAEVYFSRPNDLSYFARADKAKELANTFNPYWDARLVDTSYIDRTLALSIDQQQWWLSQDIQTSLSSLKSLIDSIIR